MNLAVVGCRFYDDYEEFSKILNEYIAEHGRPNEIVCGGIPGVESFAKQYAEEHEIPVKLFAPDFSPDIRLLGSKRNKAIVDRATHALVVKTKNKIGCRDFLNKVEKKNIPLTVKIIEII